MITTNEKYARNSKGYNQNVIDTSNDVFPREVPDDENKTTKIWTGGLERHQKKKKSDNSCEAAMSKNKWKRQCGRARSLRFELDFGDGTDTHFSIPNPNSRSNHLKIK